TVPAEMTPAFKTIVDVFYAGIDRDVPRLMMYRDGDRVWHDITPGDLYSRVAAIARALQLWGIKKGDRVAILSENRPEWAIADFAALMIGGVVVPIYATQTPEHIAYMLQDSGSRVIFVSTRSQLEKVESIRAQVSLERVVLMDETSGAIPGAVAFSDL